MISINDRIEPGILKLQSVARPPMVAGEYSVKTRLKLLKVEDGGKDVVFTNDSASDEKNVIFTNNSVSFTVSAPRFVLDPALVYSVYPAANARGAYHATLPHIIFTRKTLPWEREVGDTLKKLPWLTLLLLTEQEMKDNGVTVTQMPPGRLTTGGQDMVRPGITFADWEKTDNKEINVLELPLTLFQSICPTTEELPYLAHTRQADMTDKENASVNAKGWFSVVTGNRLPQKGKQNHVFLVSLEGHQATLNTPAATNNRIRLVVLHNWAFHAEGATFAELVKALADNNDILMRIEPVELMLGAEGTPAGQMPESAAKALHYGYTPIGHNLRDGKASVSWYRGPLVPADIPTPQKYQYRSADQALRFDKATGMFDISYAAAWQLGRLLALQSNGFATLINNWKDTYKRERPLNIAKAILQETNGINPEDLAAVINDVESDEILTDYIIELWNRP